MGSIIETNDTLQLTREQGFPAALDLEIHLKTPYKTKDFGDRIFEFKLLPPKNYYYACI